MTRHTLTCPACGTTITTPTKAQTEKEARALDWYYVGSKARRAMCRPCVMRVMRYLGRLCWHRDYAPF